MNSAEPQLSPATVLFDDSQSRAPILASDNNHRFECLGLDQQIHRAAAANHQLDGYLKEITAIVSEQSAVLAMWISKRDESGCFSQIHSVTDEHANSVWQLVENECRGLIENTVSQQSVCSCTVEKHPYYQLVVTPINLGQIADYVVIGCFSTKDKSNTRQQWLMWMVGQSFTNWLQQKNLEQADIKTRSLSDALSLVQYLDQTSDIREASMIVVNHLRRICESEQVVISCCLNKGRGEITAISDVERVEAASESNKLINHACNQAIVEKRMLIYPSPDDEQDAALLPLEQYCKSNRLEGCVNIPLMTQTGKVLGAILIAVSKQRILQPGFSEYLGRMASMISGHLDIVLRANRGLLDLLISRIQSLKSKSWIKPFVIGLGLLALLMCVPIPYRVACDCEIQPVMRRFVSAPYEGILEKTLVQHGDVVTKDQVLAIMDGRQLRIELAGLKAEYEGAKKRCDSALAKSDYANSQIAQSEMNRFQSQVDLLEQRVVNLEIRSPIDGVIVSGDLEKVEGAPLELGQTLFEIGPLDQMLAEVAIPEEEIRYVKTGMDATIKLNAFPFKSWTGEIQKVYPRTEFINDQSVFIGQVQLHNDQSLLRPGLKGSAKVQSSAHPIGWNLFHRAWESVRYWMIW